jgi:hypothetical protein
MKQVLAGLLVLAMAAPAAHADPQKDETHSEQDGWKAAFAGSVMVAAAGGTLILWGHNRIDSAEHALCTGDYTGADCGHPPPPTATMVDDLNSKGSTGQTVARVGLGVLITGVVLAGITGYEAFGVTHKEESGVTVTPTVGPSGAGASLSLRW